MPTLTRQPSIGVFETEHLMGDLKGRAVRGGVVTLSAQGVLFLLQTIGTVVLARLLTPGDFGLVAMVTALTGLVRLLKDAGLPQATIQRQEITHRQISTLFWVNVGLGAALMVITAAMAPAVSWLYADSRLTGITMVTGVGFLFSGLTVQHDALLKRQMRYSSLALKDVVSTAAGTAVGITLAVLGAGYWALVAMPAAIALTHMLLAWSMVHWRPGLPARAAGVRSMFLFGGHLTGSQLIAYLDRNTDNVLIGWYWGAGPLGLYAAAYRLLMLPLRQLNAPVGAVAVPALSRLQNDPERHARFYLRMINVIMWISAPLIGFLFLAAEPVVVLALGQQWRDAAAVFQILALCALTQPLYNTTGWLFISRGRTDQLLRLGLVISPAVIGSFAIGLPFGITGVALGYSLVLLTILPWVFRYTFRDTRLTLKRFGRALLWPVCLCLAAVIVTGVALHVLGPRGDLQRLLFIILWFGTTYSLGAVVVPCARAEVLSLRTLVEELRVARRRS